MQLKALRGSKIFMLMELTPQKSESLFHEQQISPCIPPRRGGIQHPEEFMKSRNDALLAIRGLGNGELAFKLWKKLVGYHQRSLVETAFSRLKNLFGNRVTCLK